MRQHTPAGICAAKLRGFAITGSSSAAARS
jgi:hypothetical protein